MATKQVKQSNDLVMLSFGYWAKYIMPVDAATQVMSLLVKSGATMVENETVAGKTTYRPQKTDLSVVALTDVYLSDCPVDSQPRKEYLDWVRTKYELVGERYEVESYADYLKAKAEEES